MSNDRISVSRVPNYGQGGSISYTGTATNSSSLSPGIGGVWVTCSTDAWARLAPVVNATAPAALTSDFFCPASQTMWIPNDDNTGQPIQLSVIRDATNGTARFTPGT